MQVYWNYDGVQVVRSRLTGNLYKKNCYLVCLFVSLFAWGLTALSAQIGYIAP